MINFNLSFSQEATNILNFIIQQLTQFQVLSKKKLCTLLCGQNALHSDFNCAFAEWVLQTYPNSTISSLRRFGLTSFHNIKAQTGFYFFVHQKFGRLSQKNTYFKVLHSLHMRMCGTSNSGINFLHKFDVWYVLYCHNMFYI